MHFVSCYQVCQILFGGTINLTQIQERCLLIHLLTDKVSFLTFIKNRSNFWHPIINAIKLIHITLHFKTIKAILGKNDRKRHFLGRQGWKIQKFSREKSILIELNSWWFLIKQDLNFYIIETKYIRIRKKCSKMFRKFSVGPKHRGKNSGCLKRNRSWRFVNP